MGILQIWDQQTLPRAASQNILVIGAGIIGATAAYQLQSDGASVTVIDAGGSNATSTSFGWVNASFYLDPHHFALRCEGLAAYQRLARRMDLPISWCGSLNWEVSGDAFEAFAKDLETLGYPMERLARGDVIAHEPALNSPPDHALRFPTEAALDAAVCAEALLAQASRHGARVIRGVTVDRLTTTAGRVSGVETAVGTFKADQVLLAGGVGSPALLAPLGLSLPMATRPALMLKTRPVRERFQHVLVTPIGEVRQLSDGSLLMPTAVNHQASDAETVGVPDAEADVAIERLRGVLPGLDLDWADIALAYRPVPQDGFPVVGQAAEGLHVAVLHSGVTLAAIMGELIAIEMTKGITMDTDAWLAPYRPARFHAHEKRAAEATL